MKIVSAGQLYEPQFRAVIPDVVICASGYEARARFAATQLPLDKALIRGVIPFSGRKVLSRAANDIFFGDHGFEHSKELDGNDSVNAREIFGQWVNPLIRPGAVVKIVVDYSCMTRAWYGAFVKYVFELTASVSSLDLYFTYSPSQFSKPNPPSPNAVAGPLRGFYSLRPLDKPIALVIGLGYEKMRCGFMGIIDRQKRFILYRPSA